MSPIRLSMLAALLALVGCGGGVFLGFSDDGDEPPSVNLAANPTAAQAGDTIRLIAAASDDFAVDRVGFFRLESNGGSTLLGVDHEPPYQIDTTVPASSLGVVQFFARAVDDVEQTGDSPFVPVTVVN